MTDKKESNQLTPEEQMNQITPTIGLIVSGIFAYLTYIAFINSFGSTSVVWGIVISIFMFFVFFGFWTLMQNTFQLIVKVNKKSSKETGSSTSNKESPEDKLMKLKELKDSGVITEEEFKSKKEKILDNI